MVQIFLRIHGNRSRLVSPMCLKLALQLLIVLTQNVTESKALHDFGYQGNVTDHIALLAIKSQLVEHHPKGVLSSWNSSLYHCYWEGVTCGRKHNRVITLDLNSRGLGGTISPFIGNLTFLEEIDFHNNSLNGQVPSELGHLRKLQYLGLDNNTLVGVIPANLSACINLEFLFISYNELEGTLPKEFASLSKLRKIFLHHNHFKGPLFVALVNISSLEMISANYNAFTGTIPHSIGSMLNLTYLGIGENSLFGSVPMSIFNLSLLQTLEFIDNNLLGELPANIGLTLPRLQNLDLQGNHFAGSIPTSISNFTSLALLDLAGNGFTGRVPHDLEPLQNLQQLHLFGNNLEGDINFISTLVNCSKLRNLDLRGNHFSGTLPKSIANLSTTLTFMAIGDMPITGPIPAGITNLINLVILYMRESKYTGLIPHDLGKLQNLQWIDFSSNKLTGRIPESLGNLSRLGKLFLGDNKLEGVIPTSLGNCQNLLYLNISYNDLNGTLPIELLSRSAKFINLDLTRNHLEGSIPLEISRQTNLVELAISKNMLSGLIPDSLSECSALQYLIMANNFFHGSIPLSFTSLRSLIGVDLSHNNLSGSFPDYFSTFPLTYLNLSYNNLEGLVPTTGVFSNVSEVSLEGNSRLCGGIPALHLPRCAQQHERKIKRKMPFAIKLTMAIISALVGMLIIATGVYLIFTRKKKRTLSSGSVMKEELLRVSYNTLLKATDGFSSENLLGVGSFGSVYKGILDGKTVAVKVLDLHNRGASKSFLAECNALRNIRHRNLVPVITACSSTDFQGNDFKALVYEFMPNGSVDEWLHKAISMSLLQRLDIAINVAHALSYLHHECETPIVHRDLKPSNILLDNDMVAHVGDFGIARFLSQPQHPNQSSTIGISGTVGYAAPEYGLGNEASLDGDLYSYGILLLELMTGKRPTDNIFNENLSLHIYAEAALPDQVLQIVDPTLKDDEIIETVDGLSPVQAADKQREECMVSLVRVGVACSNYLPGDRMRITDAINKLRAARDILFNPIDQRS